MIPLQELRDRKLVQWAVAYLAAAWLLLQVLSLLGDAFAWPPLVVRSATVLLAVGFLGALVVAWYHGENGAQRVSGMEIAMLAGILVIAGTGIALVRPPAPTSGASVDAVPEAVAERGSIAVLPFADMSSEGDQEYFADGITEELLNVLAQLPELRVAARTSAFAYKGKDVGIDSIARALNVSHLLEGSIRKVGDRVRVTAQLIDGRTGYHVWSETYDRDLQDIFGVQDEISRSVAERLRLELGTGGASLARRETEDAEAHRLLLEGLAANRAGGRDGARRAEQAARDAIARDPAYARAHALLALSLAQQAYGQLIPRAEGYDLARQAAEHALALDPGLSEAHTVLGRIADVHDWDFAEAERRFRAATRGARSDSRAYSLHAWLLMRLGRTDESLRQARRAVELDPLSAAAHNNLGAMYAYARRPLEAVRSYENAIAINPEAAGTLSNLAIALADLGRHEEAVAKAESAHRLDPTPFVRSALGYAYARAGRREDAERTLRELETVGSAYDRAVVHAALGDDARALALLDRAVGDREDIVLDLGLDPAFEHLRDDPRMARLLARMGL